MKGWIGLCAAITISCFVSAPQAQAQERGWGLYQTSPHVGVVYVYVTPTGLAAVLQKTGAKIVTHAPNWNVVMYNDKTKVYYVSSLDEWKGQLGNAKTKKYSSQAKNAANSPPKKGETVNIAGLRATRYTVETPMMNTGTRKAEFFMTQDMQVPPQLTQILCKVYGFNPANMPHGMPLRVRYFDDAGKKQDVIDTLKCQQQVIKTASFTYPQTYKRVDNEVMVLLDEKQTKAMNDLMEDPSLLGGSDDLSSLLGSSRRPTRPASTYTPTRTSATTAYTPRPAATAARQQPPAQQQGGDWWGNIMGMFGQKK